jgi:hypothetical protein
MGNRIVFCLSAVVATLGMLVGGPLGAQDYSGEVPSVFDSLKVPPIDPPTRVSARNVMLSGLAAHEATGAPSEVCRPQNFEEFKSWFEVWSLGSGFSYSMFPPGPGFKVFEYSPEAGEPRDFDVTAPYEVARIAICPMGPNVKLIQMSYDEDYCSAAELGEAPCEVISTDLPAQVLKVIEQYRGPTDPFYNWGWRIRVEFAQRVYIGGRLGKFPKVQSIQ